MIMDSKAYDYESDISDNQDLTFRFLSKFCDEHNISLSDKQMVTLGLRKANGLYTNLGLLLSDESPVCVKVAEYDDQMNFKLKKTFEGSLLKALLDTQEQAERMNDLSVVIDRVTWERIETPSYPGSSCVKSFSMLFATQTILSCRTSRLNSIRTRRRLQAREDYIRRRSRTC